MSTGQKGSIDTKPIPIGKVGVCALGGSIFEVLEAHGWALAESCNGFLRNRSLKFFDQVLEGKREGICEGADFG